MKRLKEEIGIPLYPKADAVPPAPAANAEANPSNTELEKLQSQNDAKN